MTFKQTDLVEVLKKLDEIAEKNVFMDTMIKEAYRLYKKIPLYPGIIVGCLDNVVKEKSVSEIKKGDVVVVKDKDIFFEGKVKKIKGKIIELSNVKVLQRKRSIRITLNKAKVFRYNFSTLKHLWPSLDFEDKK